MATKRKANNKSPSVPRKRRESSYETEDEDDRRWDDWPAPVSQMEAARSFIQDCADEKHLTLLVPDKDGTHWPFSELHYNLLISFQRMDSPQERSCTIRSHP